MFLREFRPTQRPLGSVRAPQAQWQVPMIESLAWCSSMVWVRQKCHGCGTGSGLRGANGLSSELLVLDDMQLIEGELVAARGNDLLTCDTGPPTRQRLPTAMSDPTPSPVSCGEPLRLRGSQPGSGLQS